MKTNIDWSKEYKATLEKFSKKRNESIKDLEELKKRIVLKLNSQIDAMYKKRDYVLEVLHKKKELKKHKVGVWEKFKKAKFSTNLKFIVSGPIIYGMLVPGLIMHLSVEIYHQVCFRLYGIPLVKPKDYFIFDRKNLPYLNWLEKVNCFYCSYYNCLISYMQEIVGRTERFWCPIKHAKRMSNPHRHYEFFVNYSEAKSLRDDWKKLREFEEIKNPKKKIKKKKDKMNS